MGRRKIHAVPPKQVKVTAPDAYRILVLQGKLSLLRSEDVTKGEVVATALDALERDMEGAHVTVTG